MRQAEHLNQPSPKQEPARHRGLVLAWMLLALALVAVACGNDDEPGETLGDVPTTAQQTTTSAKATSVPDTETSADTTPTPPSAQMLDGALEEIVAETGVPAIGVAIFDHTGPVASAASGLRQRGSDVPVTVDDQFHIGSNTKAMTALLLALLNDDGILSFDTTMSEAFAETSVDPGYAQVTLRQMLTHTAGVPTEEESDLDESLFDLPSKEGRATAADLMLSTPPFVAPGTMSHYSNLGYVTVGAAMEAATGTAWEDLMIERLFTPLDMESCGFGPPGTDDQIDQPSGHDDTGQPAYWDNPSALGPAGTVHCSMEDWGRLLVVLLNTARGESTFVSDASIQQLFQTVDAPVEGFPGMQSAPGWLVINGEAGIVYVHDGSNNLWYSQAVIAPDDDRVMLAVTNERVTGQQAVGLAIEAMVEAYPPNN